MGTIGAENLLNAYGGCLGVAEAYLEGRLNGYEQRFVSEVVDRIDLEAARIRIEMKKSEPHFRLEVGTMADQQNSAFDRPILTLYIDHHAFVMKVPSQAVAAEWAEHKFAKLLNLYRPLPEHMVWVSKP